MKRILGLLILIFTLCLFLPAMAPAASDAASEFDAAPARSDAAPAAPKSDAAKPDAAPAAPKSDAAPMTPDTAPAPSETAPVAPKVIQG